MRRSCIGSAFHIAEIPDDWSYTVPRFKGKRYVLPIGVLMELRHNRGLKSHHRSFNFLMGVLEHQKHWGSITERQRERVIATCKRFGYDPENQITELDFGQQF